MILGVGLGLALGLFALSGRFWGGASDESNLFGGGGVLVFRGTDGTARALRFVGPEATDTVSEDLADVESLATSAAAYFAPSGATLVSCVRPGTDNREVCVRSAEGDVGDTLTANPGDDLPMSWSPDGAWATYASDSASSAASYSYDVFAVHLATGRHLRFSEGPFQDLAVWSPDGSRIAVLESAGEGDSLVVMSFEGERQAGYGFAGSIKAVWSPDGRELLVVQFTDAEDADSRLFRIAPGEPPRSLPTPLPTSMTWHGRPMVRTCSSVG